MRKFLLAMLVLMLALSVAVVAIACDKDPVDQDPNGGNNGDPIGNGDDPVYIGISLAGSVRDLGYGQRADLEGEEFFSGDKGVGKVQSGGRLNEAISASRSIVEEGTKFHEFVASLSFREMEENYLFVPVGEDYVIQDGNTVTVDIIVDEAEIKVTNLVRVRALRVPGDTHIPGTEILAVEYDNEVVTFGEEDALALYGVPMGIVLLPEADGYEINSVRVRYEGGIDKRVNRAELEETDGFVLKDYSGEGLAIIELTFFMEGGEDENGNGDQDGEFIGVKLDGLVRDLYYNPRTDLQNTEFFSGDKGVGRVQSGGRLNEPISASREIVTKGMTYFELLESINFKGLGENYKVVALSEDYGLENGQTVRFDIIIDEGEIEVADLTTVRMVFEDDDDEIQHLPGAFIFVEDDDDNEYIVATIGEDETMSVYGIPVGISLVAGADDFGLKGVVVTYKDNTADEYPLEDLIPTRGFVIEQHVTKGIDQVKEVIFFLGDSDDDDDDDDNGNGNGDQEPTFIGITLIGSVRDLGYGQRADLANTEFFSGNNGVGTVQSGGRLNEAISASSSIVEEGTRFYDFVASLSFGEMDENYLFVPVGEDYVIQDGNTITVDVIVDEAEIKVTNLVRVRVLRVPGDTHIPGTEILAVEYDNEVVTFGEEDALALYGVPMGIVLFPEADGYEINSVRVLYEGGIDKRVNRADLEETNGFVLEDYSGEDLAIIELTFFMESN